MIDDDRFHRPARLFELQTQRSHCPLRNRYQIVARTSLLDRTGFLAGDDRSRARALGEAMTLPGVKAVVVARGGYGATRIVQDLPWDELAQAPRWVVGFSDVTALHAELSARGVASVHAPNGYMPTPVQSFPVHIQFCPRKNVG